jgi:Transposase
MKKGNRGSAKAEKPQVTVGIDLGDRFSRYCIVNAEGEVMEEGRIATTAAALERHFGGEARQRIAMECGTHSPWVSRLLRGMGHEVWVANTRKLRAITASESKNDRNDAEKLARFAAYHPQLLSPIQHRSPERQRDLNLLQARHPGTGANHAGEYGARVGQERRPPAAQVFDRIVCPSGWQGDSCRLRVGGPTTDRAGGAAHRADPADGPADRGAGEALSGSGKTAQRTRGGPHHCDGLRLDAGLARQRREEPSGGSLPGVTPAAIPIGRLRSAASHQQGRQ